MTLSAALLLPSWDMGWAAAGNSLRLEQIQLPPAGNRRRSCAGARVCGCDVLIIAMF